MIEDKFRFSFNNIQKQYKEAKNHGYSVVTCEEFVLRKNNGTLTERMLINRVDIDFSVKKAERLGHIFKNLGIKASFFVRLHAPQYNPFSFENYRILKSLLVSGNEIGYHSEVIDQFEIWNESLEENLLRDIEIINRMFNMKISGLASHRGMTGFNNLNFWKNRKASDYGLLYEAYDWFNETFYISDSEWTQWKCYDRGILQKGDRRCLVEHLADAHPIIYLLIHSDTYFDRHIYE